MQGVLNKYTTFHRADGHTVKLPMDEGEGQHWDTKPGNFYSVPEKIHIDPAASNVSVIQIHLTKIVAPIEPAKDTEWIKHIKIQSAALTKFWGRPMYLGAIVVIPEGWASHPNAHYPLLLDHGHFPHDFNGFRTTPPSPDMTGYQLERAQSQYKFYQDWTTGKLPRMLLLLVQHANPYYDDSYAVDSANVGPYGEAINRELIPAIEKQFRGIGQGWARAVYGGSTGGWETLATQIFYPDDFNGAWGACPDPVDFHAYQTVNIYDDTNAYWTIGPFGRIAQSEMRTPPGIILATTEGTNRWELVLGTHGRSGEQWDIWQAVFSPAGPDGYPAEIWNQRTGVIDKKVAAYWREHYDLTAIMQRDWKTLGPKLQGKLHVMVGTADTFFLDGAVHLMQHALEAHHRAALRRHLRLRRRPTPLLHRPPGQHHPRRRPNLHPTRPPRIRISHAQDRAPRRRHHQLALLIPRYSVVGARFIASPFFNSRGGTIHRDLFLFSCSRRKRKDIGHALTDPICV